MRVRIEGAVGMVLYRNRGEGLPRSAEPRNVGPCEQAHDVLVAPAEFRRRAADDCYRPHSCGRRRPENIKTRGRQGTKFYFESANADVVGTWRPQHEWQCPAISNVDGQGLSTPQVSRDGLARCRVLRIDPRQTQSATSA